MRHEHTVDIDRPLDEVFTYTEDPDNAPDWAEGIVRFQVLEETADHVGTRYRMVVDEGGRDNAYEGIVTAWEEMRRTVNRIEREGMAMEMERRYAPSEEGTRLTMAVDVELEGTSRLMAPLIWLMNRRFLRKQADALKALLEHER